MNLLKTIILAGLFLSISMAPAQAEIFWDWEFLNSNETFGSNDTVTLHGRLFNNSTAGETIGIDPNNDVSIVGFEAHPIPYYSFHFGANDDDPFEVFNTPVIAGSYRDFVFGREFPVGVPEGEYTQAAGIDLRTGFEDNAPLIWRIDRDFNWTVKNVNAVPEPASLTLFALGLGGLLLRNRYQA